MSSSYAYQRLRTHERNQIPQPRAEEREQQFVNIGQIVNQIKKRFRPPAIQNAQTYAVGTTITPVIIVGQ